MWGHEQRCDRDRQNRDGQDETHYCRRLRAAIRPPRAARDRASVRRWPSSAMTAIRSGSLIVDQAVISAAVRPQPMHKADSGSMTQTLMQGVETLGTAPHLSGRMPDEKPAPGGDLAELLRCARDVAGLPADRAARQRDHEQGAGAAQERGKERMGHAKRDEAERDCNDERRAPGGGER